ncbi:GMP synthase [Cordyceps javanica]|uniref:GMP synthase n=1 Tax=Cordyceps javanica TaxID=43265 RepID=A0A545UXL6_9HYPO|nr:GMP synthase [Cordyceps javanica]TQW06091.1 GMP synthase [Cordyceps javanica]
MSKFGNFVKNGWHPEKEGTTFKGQMKGLVGRGDSKDDERNKDHVSRPLHTLTDPSELPPPPQRRGTGLAPGPPPSSSGGEKRKVVTAPSKYQDPHGPRVQPPARTTRVPLSDQEQQDDQQQMTEEAPAPPRPYRTNTTGLRTDHLPTPPGRRDGADGRSPPSYSAATGTAGGATRRAVPALPGRAGGAAPSLPPRLPPRGAAGGGGAATPPPSASPQSTGSGGLLNQGAVSRLGAAGVSVPGFGIGKSNNTSGGKQQDGGGGENQINELQNRFARFNPSSPSAPSTTNTQQQQSQPGQGQGTTLAQKQAALRTASQLHKDPAQVSLADARAAAGTANNFRQRHGDQVAAGYGKAQAWNQKYGVADRVGGFANKLGGQPQQQQQQQQGVAATAAAEEQETGVTTTGAVKKKPPPPPPKKKPGLAAPAVGDDGAPPPVPMSTRPNF